MLAFANVNSLDELRKLSRADLTELGVPLRTRNRLFSAMSESSHLHEPGRHIKFEGMHAERDHSSRENNASEAGGGLHQCRIGQAYTMDNIAGSGNGASGRAQEHGNAVKASGSVKQGRTSGSRLSLPLPSEVASNRYSNSKYAA